MIFRFENCVLDIERRELCRGDVLCPIEPQVFDLLEFLIRNRERVVSKDDLVNAVWKGRIVSDAALDTCISAARHAIGDSGNEQRLISTLRTKGLRFIGRVGGEMAPNLTASAIDTTAPSYKLAWSVIGTPIVAVCPPLNMTDNCQLKHLIDGLMEEIIIELAKVGWFSTKMWPAPFTGQPFVAMQSARKSGMHYFLQGTLRKTNNRLRLNLILSESLTGHQIWAERYEHELGNFPVFKNDLARQIMSIVANQVYAAESARANFESSKNFSTWQCIIRALRLISTRKRADIDAAEKLLGRAISISPKSAAVYSLQSFISTLRVHLGWQSRSKMLPALGAAEKALKLNPDEPWAHLAIGYALTQTRPDESIEPLEHALKLDPNLSMAHYLIALALAFSGDSERAFRHADVAEYLSARGLLRRGNATHDNVRAVACIVAERYREGMGLARKVLTQCPQQTPAHRALIVNAACAGEHKRARGVFSTLQQYAPTTREWLDEFSIVWRQREQYQKYVEAFRMMHVG